MALVSATYSTAQTNRTLIAAQPDQVIVVTRILFTCWNGASIKLVSDPGGLDEAALTEALHAAAGQPLDLVLGREFGLTGGRGKAVGYTSAYQSTSGPLTVLLWFEVLP